MKYAVIDIGSNSVRLMISVDGKTLFKRVIITRLAEGLCVDGNLADKAIVRTVNAVVQLCSMAKTEKVDKTFIFATAAVRQAKNSVVFTDEIKRMCKISVDVVSGENEAILGAMGAIKNGSGIVVDVGGASSEIVKLTENNLEYAKSIDIGCVKLNEMFNDDVDKMKVYLDDKLKGYGNFSAKTVYSIGGTATSIVAILLGLDVYDASKVDGYFVKKECLKALADKLLGLTVEDRAKLKGLQKSREQVIASGAYLLYSIIEYVGADGFTASESDNLEGYLKYKVENV